MAEDIIFKNCKTGVDFENKTLEFLRLAGFNADKTGRNDGGIDIIATKDVNDFQYKFYIQCKYFNTTLGRHPIQEVYAGANYYADSNGKGIPVVITNNRVTREARLYAKRLGVEIIGDAEWQELKLIRDTNAVTNPNTHKGLFGLIIAKQLEYMSHAQSADYLKSVLAPDEPEGGIIDDEGLALQIKNEFDEAEEFIKESARLYYRATQNQQKAMTLHKQAILRQLRHG